MSEWKETDFGKIPFDWDLKKIIEIKSDDKRAIAMGPFGSNIKAENFVEIGVPVIRGTNLNFDKYVGGQFVYLTEDKANELIGSNCFPGDLVFTHRGTIGQVGLIPYNKFRRYVISQSGMKLTVNPDLMDNEFLFYFFKSEHGQYQILKYEAQVGVPSISNPLTSLKEIEVPVPKPKEQRAIASLLSSLDDKIDLLNRQNATLEAMAETLFRQWFVEEANTDSIAQLVYIQNGYAFKSKDFKENGSNGVVKIKNISGGIIDIENTDFIDESVAISVQDRFKILTGDILIAMTGAEIGKLGIIPKTDKNLWLNQRVGLLKEKFTGSKYLAYLQLKSEFGQDYIENTATGSAQPNISGTGIENCGFPQLTENQIKGYSFQIGELYEKVIFNLGQIHTLTALRDALLPKLMSGEVRVEL